MADNKRSMTAEDLYNFELVTDAKIQPSGKHVVFSVQRIDRSSEKKYSNLWLVDTDGGAPRQFTVGDHVDTSPAWSPDGNAIAFLSNRNDEKQSQLFVISTLGGEARQITELEGQIGSFEWSPDGSQFVIMFRKKDADAAEREKDEVKKQLGVVDRHFTRVFNRNDGGTYTPKELWHVWTVDAKTGDATQITDGPIGEFSPTWSPDGQTIAFQTDDTDNWDLDLDHDVICTVPAGGGEPTLIHKPVGGTGAPVYSPDGTKIAYRGRPDSPGKWYQNESLFVFSVDGDDLSAVKDLTTPHDYDMGSSTLGDSGSLNQSKPIWSPDGKTLYSTSTRFGSNPLMAIDVASGSMSQVFSDNSLVIALEDFDSSHNKLVYLSASQTDPGQLMVHDFSSGQTTQLTHLNDAVLSEVDLGTTEEVWVTTADEYNVHGWVLTPPDFDPSKTYPTLLYIHGGPQTQYGRAFMHEFYFLAAQGYVIGYSNPRGGQGYGEEHAKAIYGQWGTVDYDDLMAFTDYLADLPYVDAERMGVVGGSYGGYMTGMIIGMTGRFKAACAQRMVSNLVSFHGTSDFNWAVKYLVGLEGEPWNNLEDYWRMSPLSMVGNVTTPTQVIHAENDLRCAAEQGEQYFVALRRHGVDSELVLFPGESHGLSRNGRTDRRVARLNHIVRWFDKYLK